MIAAALLPRVIILIERRRRRDAGDLDKGRGPSINRSRLDLFVCAYCRA